MSDKGYCEKCGAYQFLSYHVCNYNGICKGRILPELNYKVVLSETGKKSVDENIYKKGKVVARKEKSVFVWWDGAVKPMWMPETYISYNQGAMTSFKVAQTFTEVAIKDAWEACGSDVSLDKLLNQLKK